MRVYINRPRCLTSASSHVVEIHQYFVVESSYIIRQQFRIQTYALIFNFKRLILKNGDGTGRIGDIIIRKRFFYAGNDNIYNITNNSTLAYFIEF